MEWTREKTLYFIDMYRKKDVLWDPKHPRYFNKICKNDAWEELASELQTTADECRKKMTGLLSSLRREKAKIKRSVKAGKGMNDFLFVLTFVSFCKKLKTLF